jgi:hypothetical protein
LPRFYFDVSVGDDFTRDDVGFDYESLEVAEYEATRAASEIGHEALPKRRASDVVVKVRDEVGYQITVEVAMAVRRINHRSSH